MPDGDPLIPSGLGVAIVAPSGYVEDGAALLRGIGHLEALGCRVKRYHEQAAVFQRFGASDEARAAQLHAAIDDPEVRLVIALRGGYGMSRLLPLLDLGRIAASGKLLVGHSDFTVLQMALLQQCGTVSFAGPMLSPDFSRTDISAFTLDHFWRAITSPQYTFHAYTTGNPVVDVRGTLWGGNLAMLTHLTGTPYLPSVDGGILFLEDVNEHPYRVERMLLQLLHAGILQQQRAVVLGDFSGYRLSDYDNGYDFAAMLRYIRGRLQVPVLTGLPFGHMRDKVTLAVGSHAHLASDASGFRLTMQDYPTL
jgi:muramoyltetrapeptide carboxypeptidase